MSQRRGPQERFLLVVLALLVAATVWRGARDRIGGLGWLSGKRATSDGPNRKREASLGNQVGQDAKVLLLCTVCRTRSFACERCPAAGNVAPLRVARLMNGC